MPTGYTAEFEERALTFPEFVWKCARAFGAFVHQRDEGVSAAARRPEKDTYHMEGLKEAQVKLEELDNMSSSEAEAKAQAEYKITKQEYENTKLRKNVLVTRLNKVLAEVQAWKPPTADHQGLKAFMIEQIQSTLEWDGKMHGDEPALKTAAEWLKAAQASALWSIEYHAKALKEDAQRDDGRNDWIDQLQASVPFPGKPI